jgi:HPt (histidine-containing phosphotransfer) domain-containing protein
VTDPDVLNPGALAALEEMTGGDVEFLAELIDTWLSDATSQIAMIEQAVFAHDAEALRRAAHTLKSTSQSLGVGRLAGACAGIEALARAGSITAVGALIPDLRHRHEQARAALIQARPVQSGTGDGWES